MLGKLQQVGKAFMLPIAVMPAAAILLRLGALLSDPNLVAKGSIWFQVGEVLSKGAGAIFDNLPILFAVGVTVGMTGGAGAAALAAVVGYMVLKAVVGVHDTEDNKLDTGVLGGIITGLVTAYLYRKYHNIRLPDWLQFFGGKRFVPIVTSVVMIGIGVVFLFVWPEVQKGIQAAGDWLIGVGAVGLFAYGLLNRLLIPFGLHHILNTLVWYTVGTFTKGGHTYTGDLTRFFAGDPTAGSFMAGFYPIMMFALPAAALAMIRAAKPEKRAAVRGVLLSVALTAFLTGITEPIEYMFMFLAPVLYGIHALLTGTSMALLYLLDIRHGFGFSAGFIDYVINYPLAHNAFWIIPIGLVYAVLYYMIFRFAIEKWNLPTPGRLEEGEDTELPVAVGKDGEDEEALAVLRALGGKENIEQLDACITRLRLTVKDEGKLDTEALKRLGASGVVRLGKGNYQAVFGTRSELLKDRILKWMEREDEG
ncbi:PTS transporter subunit EIIC [Polycladomyces subterraneus]|uniref:PTS transporter subunit EIIC n=1 Tax=Polycladomyces subterraneus TaxID=1016997 RepID=A0ABT8IKY8_9BACL|nr:PTS transporter subunit EIIC [Polycladomyces subterraneus]MDN4593448.1 PTS transporter subunit EIIC [Polycladomyces subterraneus]